MAQNLLSAFGNLGFFLAVKLEFDPLHSTKMYTLTELEKCMKILNDRNLEGKLVVKVVI